MVRRNNSSRKALALQQRSFSVTVEQPPSGLSSDLPTSEVVIIKQPCKSLLITESIDINVIQPTPNISPSASLTAINDQSANAAAGAVLARDATAVAACKSSVLPAADDPITTNNVPASSPVAKKQSSHVRRVSFSEDEVTSVCSDPAGESPHRTRRTSRGGSLATSTRQMTVPMAANATMSYLQVLYPNRSTIRGANLLTLFNVHNEEMQQKLICIWQSNVMQTLQLLRQVVSSILHSSTTTIQYYYTSVLYIHRVYSSNSCI